MSTTTDKPKRRKLHVSRVVKDLDGQRYRFSMTPGGLLVRRWRSRKTKLLSFSQLLDLSNDQFPLL